MKDLIRTLLSRFPLLLLAGGVVILVIGSALGWLLDGATGFFQSYLFAFLFWLGLSLGMFVLLLAQHIAGGSWGATIRRPLESGTILLPVMALFFIPIVFGLSSLYIWTQPEAIAESHILANKIGYLNTPFFLIRAVVYFGLWTVGALFFVLQGRKQDAGNGQVIAERLKKTAPLWFVIYILTMTFAGVDWGMSLTPEWFSGIYSVTLMISQAIGAMALVIVSVVFFASRNATLDQLLTAKRLQDLGNYLMAFTIFWAYVNFSQIIILWSNNIVETNTFYVLRFGYEWRNIGYFLLFFGFFGTFLILLSRWVKRKRLALTVMAVWAFVVQIVNLFYVIVPSYARSGSALTLTDVLLFIGLGGIWLGLYFLQLSSQSLVPLHDPRIEPIISPQGVQHA
jgi:hypothetical protein